jgi:hypothetical protein
MTRRGTEAESPNPGTRPAITTRAACTLVVTLTICAALVAPVRVSASGAAQIAAAPEATSGGLTPTPFAGTTPATASPSPKTTSGGLTPTPFAGTTPATLAASPSPQATSATLVPILSPNRPGAKGALTLAVQYTGGEQGVPSPVHRSVLSLPAGLTLEVPSLRSCSAARLQAQGPKGCPPQSLIGRGHALAKALAGSNVIEEEVELWAFIGPPQGNTPTLELLGEGTTPVPAQVVITGTVVPAHAPYGEQLVIPIPPVPSLPSVSETSLANLTLTIGASGPHPARNANTVVVPRCPAGGWPFAAAFTYADGSSGSTVARQPCPAKAKRRSTRTKSRAASGEHHPATSARAAPRARSAASVSLHESGNLRLTSKQGFTLNEQGSASGTFNGTIHVRLTIVSSSHVRAAVSISRGGGSISGEATASYHKNGASASFTGSMSVSGGTGSYSHAHGSGLSFDGTIQNANDAIAVHLNGPISD